MKKIKIMTRSKRLDLIPMTDDELRALIEETEDEGLKLAYGEMLAGCLSDPDNRLWHTPWKMVLKKERKRIGDLSFKGPPKDDAAEIGYGIDPAYENQGYTTEAAKAMLDWAFQSDELFFIEAEAEADNAASLRVIEKLGMKQYGMGEEGPRFVVEKPKSSWLAVYMCFGLAIGLSLGNLLFDNMSVGMCIGLVLGAAVGASLDKAVGKKLEAARTRRRERLGDGSVVGN